MALIQVWNVKAACGFVGKSRATLYRRLSPPPPAYGPRRPFHHPAELSEAERDEVMDVLNSDRFVDKSPAQVWAILLDEGVYLCSQSTMYRLMRAREQTRERRAQAVHPARKKPELMADAPNTVWSWDITKLKGPVRGTYYDLYVVLDIFSRKVIHWVLWPTETAELAKEFITAAVERNGGIRPDYLHADRGTSMTSNTLTGLLAKLEITKTHSRPSVSNDNPYSEAQFKTLKYCPAFPERFGSIEDARVFCEAFFAYYNNEHRHSGIAYHTPATVHNSSWQDIQAKRVVAMEAAWAANPRRFPHGGPKLPTLPTKVWINQPPASIQTETTPQSDQAA
jgi:transposase InsO family protein